MTLDVFFRRAGPSDLGSTYQVFVTASNDLRARAGRPPIDDTPQRRAWAIPFRRHALAHDAERFWVAELDDRVVGFAIATLRQRLWYLAALHVLPEYQGQGVGRELLERCLAAAGEPPRPVRIVISESAQPVSNALYAKHGMYQWVPLLHMTGAIPTQLDEPRVASEVRAADAVPAELELIDRAVLGVARTIDHRYWASLPGLTGLLFRRRHEALGYAYVSASGQIGPVAVRAVGELPHILSASLRFASGRGIRQASLVVPGHCRAGLAYLLRNGFNYSESVNLLLASRPFGHMDRYLVSAVDALF